MGFIILPFLASSGKVLGLMVRGLGFKVQDLKFRVEGLVGLRLQRLWFMVYGLCFRV